jgi:hypothetical protein
MIKILISPIFIKINLLLIFCISCLAFYSIKQEKEFVDELLMFHTILIVITFIQTTVSKRKRDNIKKPRIQENKG